MKDFLSQNHESESFRKFSRKKIKVFREAKKGVFIGIDDIGPFSDIGYRYRSKFKTEPAA